MPASCPVAATLLGTGSSARGRDPSVVPPPPVGGAAKGAPPEAPSSPRGAFLPRVLPLLPVSLLRPSGLAGLAAPCPNAGVGGQP